MPTIAIFANESARRGALESVARVVGALIDGASDVAALRRLLERRAVEFVLADGIAAEDLASLAAQYHATRFVVLAESDEATDLILAGAAAVLARGADAK